MTEFPDYERIYDNIPSDKPREDYTYNERRATIYKLLMQRGDPAQLPSYRSLADRFGVKSTETIHKDVNKYVKPFIRENLSTDVKVRMKTLLDKSIEEYIRPKRNSEGEIVEEPEPEDYEKAFKLMKEFGDWLFDEGSIEKAPEKKQVEMEGSMSVDSVMSEIEKNLEKAEQVENKE